MKYISETRNKDINFLIQSMNYTQLHNKLGTILSKEEIRLLAKPDISPDTTAWFAEAGTGAKIVDHSNLTDAQKDELADIIEQLREQILFKLNNNKDFSQIAKVLFSLPQENDIKCIIEENKIVPVFTQWACNSNLVRSSIDPLSTLLGRPRVNTDDVTIRFNYHTGEPAINKTVYFFYNEKESEETTGDEGLYHRGRCRIGSSFTVYCVSDGKKKYQQHFTVVKGGEYRAVFPLLTSATVKIIDQHEAILVGETIYTIQENGTCTYVSDENGIVILENIIVGVVLVLKDTSSNPIIQQQIPERNGNEFIFKLERKYTGQCRIRVVNEMDQPLPGVSLLTEQSGKHAEYISDESGIINAGEIAAGSQLKVINKLNLENFTMFVVKKGFNDFIFRLVQLPEKMVTVRFIDAKKNPLVNTKVDFSFGSTILTLESDINGVCQLPFKELTDKETIKTFIHLSRKRSRKQR